MNWKIKIEQNGIPVVIGQAKYKEDALREMFHYLDQFAEEDFDKITVIIERIAK